MRKNAVLVPVMLMVVLFLAFPTGSFAGESGPTNYVLVFQGTEYDSKLGSAVEYFFKEMLKPEDNMLYLTPQKPYQYSQQTRQSQSLEKLIETTKDVLKRDIGMGAASYMSIFDQMVMLVKMLSEASTAEVKNQLVQYRQLMENLRSIRKWDESMYLKIAGMFQKNTGANHLIIFYQTELRPIPNKRTLDNLRSNPDTRFEVNEIFEADSTKDPLNVEKVAQALKESGAKLHFVYMQIKMKSRQDMEIREFSNDIYNAYSKIARETGGKVITTSIPVSALKEIAEAKQ